MTDESKAIKPYDRIKLVLRSDEAVMRFKEILGERAALPYISSVLIAVANDDKLQECTPGSVMVSAMRAATLHLSCDPMVNEAHLVAYGNKATFISGYKGLYKMAIRTDKYRYLNVSKVFEGETIVEDRMRGIHRLEGGRTGYATQGWLFYMELYNGFVKSFYLSVEEIHAHAQKYSKQYSNPNGPWKKSTESMERKTMLRIGLTRYGYLDPADLAVLNVTDEEPVNGDAETIDARFRDPSAPRPVNEILSELGYETTPDDEPSVPEPEQEPEPQDDPEITLEEAMTMKSKSGMAYGDIPDNELKFHLNGIEKALKKPDLDVETRITYERKQTAINLVLASRVAA